MHRLRRLTGRNNRHNAGRLIVVVALCISVVMQVLGVPATLLDPSADPDTVGASVLEGFSIPSTLPGFGVSSTQAPYSTPLQTTHLPLLSSSLFHPPVL
jgi:hypothetical protein